MANVFPYNIFRFGSSANFKRKFSFSSFKGKSFELIVAESSESAKKASLMDIINHCFGVVDLKGHKNSSNLMGVFIFEKSSHSITDLLHFFGSFDCQLFVFLIYSISFSFTF